MLSSKLSSLARTGCHQVIDIQIYMKYEVMNIYKRLNFGLFILAQQKYIDYVNQIGRT